MGAWAEDTFGNDTACDWLRAFLEQPGLPMAESAIQAVLDTHGSLDSDKACKCLAACEVLARLQGNCGLRNAYSEALDKWITANPTVVPGPLKLSAEAAIQQILGPNSELLELWDEDGHNDAWHQAVENLRVRVRG